MPEAPGEFAPQAFIAWASAPDAPNETTWLISRAQAKVLLADQAKNLTKERIRYHAAHQAMQDFRAALAQMGHAWIEDMVADGHDPADAEEEVRESVSVGLWAAATGVNFSGR